jgi:hypothetical protein
MAKSRRIQYRRKSRVRLFSAKNKYRRNEPRRKGKRKSTGGAEVGSNKNMCDQGVEGHGSRLEKP